MRPEAEVKRPVNEALAGRKDYNRSQRGNIAGKGDAMRTRRGWGRTFAFAFVVLAALQGCATPRSASMESEPPGLSVRLPVGTPTTIDIESPSAQWKTELPLSVVDETRGRWLTLFELNYSPAKPSRPRTEAEP